MRIVTDPLSVAILDWGCGVTVDLFRRESSGAASIQWLWAMPLDGLAARGLTETAVLDRVTVGMLLTGFEPNDGESPHRVLPNGFSHENECPFAAEGCSGGHLVVSGSGLVGGEQVTRAVTAVGRAIARPRIWRA